MKVTFTIIFTIVILFGAHAQWEQANGPGYSIIYCIATKGSDVYAGTNMGGVYLSTNNGSNWKNISIKLTNSKIKSLVINDNKIFAVTENEGVYLSTNKGINWDAINNGFPKIQSYYYDILTYINITSIDIIGTNIFAGTASDGLFLSTNNGANWKVLDNDFISKKIYSVFVYSTNIFLSTQAGVYLSTNNGTNWDLVSNGKLKNNAYFFASSGSSIFAVSDYGLYMSTDMGKNWNTLNTGFAKKPVSSILIDGPRIYIGTEGQGILLSTNNGSSWNILNNRLTSTTVLSLGLADTNLYAGTNEGVFLSTNSGGNWSVVNNGLSEFNIESITISGQNIYAYVPFKGFFLSTDDGNCWKTIKTDFKNSHITAIEASGDNLYVGTSKEGIFLSTNKGDNWKQINDGIGNIGIMDITVNGNNIYTLSYKGEIYFSKNKGKKWKPIIDEQNLKFDNNFDYYRSLAVKGDNIFVGTTFNGIILTTNFGKSWKAGNNGMLDNKKIYSNSPIYYSRSTNEIICRLYTTSIICGENFIIADIYGEGVFLSSNNGIYWKRIKKDVEPDYYIYTIAIYGKNIFIGSDDGITMSSDYGENWNSINTGLVCKHIKSIAFNNNYIFVGTRDLGIWKRPLSELIGEKK